jgi:hypothetical protein
MLIHTAFNGLRNCRAYVIYFIVDWYFLKKDIITSAPVRADSPPPNTRNSVCVTPFSPDSMGK